MADFWYKVDVSDYTDVHLTAIGYLRASLYDFWKATQYRWGEGIYTKTFEEIDLMDLLLLVAVPAGDDNQDKTSS